MLTVKGIVEKWLRDNDYTGLYCEECGCEIDDLMPCAGWDNSYDGCHPGYKHNCPNSCDICHMSDWCAMDKSFTSWYISGEM